MLFRPYAAVHAPPSSSAVALQTPRCAPARTRGRHPPPPQASAKSDGCDISIGEGGDISIGDLQGRRRYLALCEIERRTTRRRSERPGALRRRPAAPAAGKRRDGTGAPPPNG